MARSQSTGFATVTLAHLKTMETQKDYQNRGQWKAKIMQSLYKSGFDNETVVKLYKFIDWLMFLPDEFNEIFYQDMEKFEKEHKMEFVTYAERRGMSGFLAEFMRQLYYLKKFHKFVMRISAHRSEACPLDHCYYILWCCGSIVPCFKQNVFFFKYAPEVVCSCQKP